MPSPPVAFEISSDVLDFNWDFALLWAAWIKSSINIFELSEILDKVDHKNLNLDVPFLDGIITTTENVTIKIWEILEKKLESLKNTNCKLHRIRLYETSRNFVDYYGKK